MLRYLWQLIAPRTCAMCDRVLMIDEEDICPSCLCLLPRTEHAHRRENLVEQLFADEDKLLRAGSFCFYPQGHAYRNVIHHIKYGKRPEVGYMLGKQAAEEWGSSPFFQDIDMIIPLPLHKRRLRSRGYNQSEYIARGISAVTGIPVDTQHLIRLVNNEKQSQKSIEERRKMEHVFAVEDPQDLRNKTILLVDDVITSGATMQRAMDVLHAIPKCRYVVFSLACAVGHKV